MWVAFGSVLCILMFLCAYGAIAIVSTSAQVMGRSVMPRPTLASLQAEIAALREQLAAKDTEIARLKEAASKAGRRANYAETAKREVKPITEATLTRVGETVSAVWLQDGQRHAVTTHQKSVDGLVKRILNAGCPETAIKRIGF